MSDICDRADTTRELFPGPVSPYCTRCVASRHSHYPHQSHETSEHAGWLERMIALYK